MTIWSILSIACKLIGLTSWAESLWKKHEQRKAIDNAIQPYKNETKIDSRPAGTDDDVINRL